MNKTVVEYCSHCETEVEMKWDIERDGYKAFCPYCGNRLMLCDECQHRTGGACTEDCDYDTETDTCRFNKREAPKVRSYMDIDTWVNGYRVRSFPWVDGKSIYMSVSYYKPGQSLSLPPVWEKVAYITDNELGRHAVKDYLHTVVSFIAGLKIPPNGRAEITVE